MVFPSFLLPFVELGIPLGGIITGVLLGALLLGTLRHLRNRRRTPRAGTIPIRFVRRLPPPPGAAGKAGPPTRAVTRPPRPMAARFARVDPHVAASPPATESLGGFQTPLPSQEIVPGPPPPWLTGRPVPAEELPPWRAGPLSEEAFASQGRNERDERGRLTPAGVRTAPAESPSSTYAPRSGPPPGSKPLKPRPPAYVSRKPTPTDHVPRRLAYLLLTTLNQQWSILVSGAGEKPSQPLPRAIRFVVDLVVTFAIVATALLLLFRFLFGAYDELVGFVGAWLYWPFPWPGVYAVGHNVLVVPDYIFPMYLSGMAAFSVAAGLWTNNPSRSRGRRLSALGVVLAYVVVEIVLDALFFTVPGATLRNLALLVRAITGGVFLALLIFCIVHLPAPQDVPTRFPRDRAAITRFFGLGLIAMVAAFGLVGVIPYLLGIHNTLFGITLLLLVPTVTLELFGGLARPSYFRQLRRRPPPPLSFYHPDVSIIIPAYNEEEWIREAMFSADAAAAHYPGRVEIIVGNDGSKDKTSAIARWALAHLKHSDGLVVDLPHGGKSNALNGALAMARGEIVIRCDGDTVIDPGLGFAAMIPHFADPEVGAVQGSIHPRQREGWTRKLRAMEVAWNHYFLRPAGMATRSALVVDGLFSAFRRSDLNLIGGWVPWNGEDTEITLRLQRLGYRLRFESRARAMEDVPHNYDTLRKQRVRWARGLSMAVGQHYPALFSPAFEFGGLAVFFWLLMFIRSGVRSLVYLFLGLLILTLGVPAIIDTAVILLVVMVLRSIPVAYFLVKMGRSDVLPWIPFFPIGNIVKQTYRFEAFGTLGPSAQGEYA